MNLFVCVCVSGQIHIDRKLSEIKQKVDRGEEVKGGLLTHMLVTKEMNLEEIYANMTEMLLAGVDTVIISVLYIINKTKWKVCACFHS